MDTITILSIIASSLLAITTYFLKRTIDQNDRALQELKTSHIALDLNVQNFKQQVRDGYLHKDDFKEFKIELRSMFDELKSDIKSLREQK